LNCGPSRHSRKQSKKVCGTQKSNLGPLGYDESPKPEVLTTTPVVQKHRRNVNRVSYVTIIVIMNSNSSNCNKRTLLIATPRFIVRTTVDGRGWNAEEACKSIQARVTKAASRLLRIVELGITAEM
jgi:hypothetical protein